MRPDCAWCWEGRPRGFGSRRHYCFSHQGYRDECARIVTELARRYGGNRHVEAWQTDNEYGCHDTTRSYSPAALAAFRDWLRARYGDIGTLNAAWGNVFWSMDYDSFDQIGLPTLTVTEPNPSHRMDFFRFSSDQVVSFNKRQVEIIRAHSDAPILHNYMGRVTDFDHFAVGADLDIAGWDSYPLGFLEDRADSDAARKRAYMRQGDPDFQAFAHGAEAVCYFRWRQAPFAQEQMHAGLLRSDSGDAPGLAEARRVASEFAEAPDVANAQAPVAIIFDYQAEMGWQVQPQGQGLSHFSLALDDSRWGLAIGLGLIALGAGGIKPCVSAHLGDQFGRTNRGLLSRAFAWFYFAINLGAFVSSLATPWLLETWGSSVAFGVPGVLMLIATLTFWAGRHRFVHIPAGGMRFVREAFSSIGLGALGRLCLIYTRFARTRCW